MRSATGVIGNTLAHNYRFFDIIINTYIFQKPNDEVWMVLYGKYADGGYYYRETKSSAGTGDVLFRITNSPDDNIDSLDGSALRLIYQVNSTRTSEAVTYNVARPY